MRLSEMVIVIKVVSPEDDRRHSTKHYGPFKSERLAEKALEKRGWIKNPGEEWVLGTDPYQETAEIDHVLPILNPRQLPKDDDD